MHHLGVRDKVGVVLQLLDQPDNLLVGRGPAQLARQAAPHRAARPPLAHEERAEEGHDAVEMQDLLGVAQRDQHGKDPLGRPQHRAPLHPRPAGVPRQQQPVAAQVGHLSVLDGPECAEPVQVDPHDAVPEQQLDLQQARVRVHDDQLRLLLVQVRNHIRRLLGAELYMTDAQAVDHGLDRRDARCRCRCQRQDSEAVILERVCQQPEDLAVRVLPRGLVRLVDHQQHDLVAGTAARQQVVVHDLGREEEDPLLPPQPLPHRGDQPASQLGDLVWVNLHRGARRLHLLPHQRASGGHEDDLAGLRVPALKIVQRHSRYKGLAQSCRHRHQGILMQALLHDCKLVLPCRQVGRVVPCPGCLWVHPRRGRARHFINRSPLFANGEMNPLRQVMETAIRATGPISLARFMKDVLTHPQHGYYCSRPALGRSGDFTTSPEISQLFGEMVALRLVDWLRRQRDSIDQLQIIELGPGRGTLLADILRIVQQFDDVRHKVKSCTLIEVGDQLAQCQQAALAPFKVPLSWKPSIDHCLNEERRPVFILAHEFFDALPIHAFRRVENGAWREVLVDYVEGGLRLVTSAGPTPAQVALRIDQRHTDPHTTSVEVSPEALRTANWMKSMMVDAEPSFAFIADYGQAAAPSCSLRAIKDHRFVQDIFQDLGECDLSADVDFGAIQSVLNPEVETDLMYQGEFLLKTGLRERATSLIRKNRADQEACAQIQAAFERLADPKQMGSIYKVLLAQN